MIKPKDTIFHTTKTKPSFKDRIKILFGAAMIVDSEIGVSEEVDCLYSKADDYVVFERREVVDE